MLAVNLTAVFETTQTVLPGMLRAGWGRVVTIASTAGLAGYPYVAAYVAAKHGVVGLARALALECARGGVTVNAVCPGFTETDLLAGSIATVMAATGRSEAQTRDSLLRGNPQGRFVTPEEVAAAVLYLCEPGAAAMTGQAHSGYADHGSRAMWLTASIAHMPCPKSSWPPLSSFVICASRLVSIWIAICPSK